MSKSCIDKVAVLDFGGQYAHLIANRIRRLGVYSEIVSNEITADALAEYKAVILSGSPHSVLNENSPGFDISILDLGIPVLGLCYGHQLIARSLGGKVCRGTAREYGKANLSIKVPCELFKDISGDQQVWMSHGDAVENLPCGFEVLGSTSDCVCAAVGNVQKRIFGLQFHPEVTDSVNGLKILSNFLDISKCERSWSSKTFLKEIAEEIKKFCGKRNVFLLVSGGVDSTVVFALLNQTLGSDRVLGLHIDNGLMRLDESAAVIEYMHSHGFDNLKVYDASEDFLSALDGVVEPEKKRNIIGNMFLVAKEKASAELSLNPDEWVLAQGTIYPDTIESAGTKHADRIKTHHNRVDIILELIEQGKVIEPISQLYKDEVRELGEMLGLPHQLVWRHPFPGPGLGVRVLCSDGTESEVTQTDIDKFECICKDIGYSGTILPVRSVGVQGDERSYAHPALITGKRDWVQLEEISTRITNSVKSVNRVVFGIKTTANCEYKLHKAYADKLRLEKLRAVDAIVTEALHKSGEYESIWQMPVVLLPIVNGEGRECVVLRPIVSQEAMTARFVPLKDETIDEIVNKVSKIDEIGDIFFDITHKPPATIEWE